MGINPVADTLKRADKVLSGADTTLEDVHETLTEVREVLGRVEGLLSDLNDELALIKEIPAMRDKLDDVHRAVGKK